MSLKLNIYQPLETRLKRLPRGDFEREEDKEQLGDESSPRTWEGTRKTR